MPKRMTMLFVFACKHDVNWLKAVLPDDPPAVHLADCPRDERAGCYDEALGYLQFLVRHYDRLPPKLIFLHGHELSHHYDWPAPDALQPLSS